MNHDTLKRLRESLGLSHSEMAHALGISGENTADDVLSMENGEKPISEPIQKLITYLHQGAQGDDSILPAFMIGGSLEAAAYNLPSPELIFHTRYPRFMAWIAGNDELNDEMVHMPIDDGESLMVGMWMDDPDPVQPKALRDILNEAIGFIRAFNNQVDQELND